MDCIFCGLAKENNHLFDSKYFFGVWDINPVQDGHLLVISKLHRMNITELSNDELNEVIRLQKELVKIMESIETVLGVTVEYNNGKIMEDKTHFHFHIMPRYKNDGFYDNQHIQQYPIDKMLLEEKLSKLSSFF